MMLRRGETGGPVTDERGNKLFAMVMYDLDQFRESSSEPFPDRSSVEDDVKEKIWTMTRKLLKFGYQYLKTCPEDRGHPGGEAASGQGPGATTMTFRASPGGPVIRV